MEKAGLTIGDLVLVAFIILKLTGVITWSWIWVLSPLWIGILLFVIVLIIGIIIQKVKGPF